MAWSNLHEDIIDEFAEAQTWANSDDEQAAYARMLDFATAWSNDKKLDAIHEARKVDAYRQRERIQQNKARALQMQDPKLREYRLLRERAAMRRYRAKRKSVACSQHGKENEVSARSQQGDGASDSGSDH